MWSLVTMGIEEHGLFHLFSAYTIQEHALMASCEQNINSLLLREIKQHIKSINNKTINHGQ